MDPFRLDGRLALVTGASRGIGLGVAHALQSAGARVILAARASDDLDAAARDLGAVSASIDLQDVPGIPAWYDALAARVGLPDILVNAAGTTRRAPAESLSMEDWNDVISLNLTAVFALSQAFARHLIAANAPGRIINIASLMTFAARRTTAAYTASKGAIGQLTKSLAVDWADKGILVNAIAPGFIETAMTAPLKDKPEFDTWVKGRTPLARWGRPEDIARPVVFLASPAADFITGQVIYVDGGLTSTL
jgi:gluconate 5-dehydrogenase